MGELKKALKTVPTNSAAHACTNDNPYLGHQNPIVKFHAIWNKKIPRARRATTNATIPNVSQNFILFTSLE